MTWVRKTTLAGLLIGLSLAGCGTAARPAADPRPAAGQRPHAAAATEPRARRAVTPPLQALVTAQTEDRLLVADLPSGRVVRSITVPGSPGYVDASAGVIVVVSAAPGAVTLLNRGTMRTLTVIHGFTSPHIPAISPDGRFAYVTDDGSGELTAISLAERRVISRVQVGAGAHHLAFTPDERQVWVALSQSARTITILGTASRSGRVDLGHPRVIGHFQPGYLAHDLLFSPGGDRVWITSADTSYVGVFSTRTRRLLFRVPVGAPPQHLAFSGGYAYLTSGYGSVIEQVSLASGRVLRRTFAPYGSFDLDAGGGYVVTASLLRGTLAIYNQGLRLLHIRQLAPSTEDVALTRP